MRLSLDAAASMINSGRVVAVPTETVYGLAASLRHVEAIHEIFAIKGRPQDNPLIVHIASKDEVELFAKELPQGFDQLADAFWPGPLTLVVPIVPSSIPSAARAGLSTAGFRIPSHPLARKLIALTGPLVMPSANISGRPSATSSEHVEADFGADFPVLDGGKCTQGLESTILYWDSGKWVIVRLGALPADKFVAVLGYAPANALSMSRSKAANDVKPLCPGQMYRHYAPRAKLYLSKTFSSFPDRPVIGFRGRRYPKGAAVYMLGSVESPGEVAENLYSVLRMLDDDGVQEAWVDIDLPQDGLWMTIRERLLKASSDQAI